MVKGGETVFEYFGQLGVLRSESGTRFIIGGRQTELSADEFSALVAILVPPAPTEAEAYWKAGFLRGAKFWYGKSNSGTMWQSEQNECWQSANLLWPVVRPESVEDARLVSAAYWKEGAGLAPQLANFIQINPVQDVKPIVQLNWVRQEPNPSRTEPEADA